MLTPCAVDLLARVPVPEERKVALLQQMTAPDRHYHALHHLELLWERHRVFAAGTALDRPFVTRLIACAIAFHDAILDTRRNDNEEMSALFWLDAARETAALTEAEKRWVADTIRASANHLAYRPAALEAARSHEAALLEAARVWFLDLDLTPIGEAPAQFALNTRMLRQENIHLDESSWDRNRLSFLSKLRHAPAIYRSPRIARSFERAARANCERELAAAA